MVSTFKDTDPALSYSCRYLRCFSFIQSYGSSGMYDLQPCFYALTVQLIGSRTIAGCRGGSVFAGMRSMCCRPRSGKGRDEYQLLLCSHHVPSLLAHGSFTPHTQAGCRSHSSNVTLRLPWSLCGRQPRSASGYLELAGWVRSPSIYANSPSLYNEYAAYLLLTCIDNGCCPPDSMSW